jgi:anhydro-N-acetylmuramic acid kinase
MSGTSHDGVDAALVVIKPARPLKPVINRYADKKERKVSGEEVKVKLMKHLHVPYNKSLREEIYKAFSGSTEHICRLNVELGEVFAKAALSLIKASGFKPEDIDAIASHGQTIYHIPPSGKKRGSTFQIGEASVIAERTGIMTICDFRSRDMAAGGQGAPLVPLADYLLFHKKGQVRAALNIGGIANVTIVRDKIDDTIAFDTGPGNSLIDEAVRYYSSGRMSFDKNGSIARTGRPDRMLLNELFSHPYFKKKPPKSTGRDTFGEDLVKEIFKRYGNLSLHDILSTLTYLTAISIHDAVMPLKPDEVIVSGGGVKNRSIMELIKSMCKDKGVPVKAISEYGIPPEAKEALSFAILGYQTLHLKPGNLPSATGASHKVVLGKIVL